MAQTEATQSASKNGSPAENEQIAPEQQVPHRLEEPPPSTDPITTERETAGRGRARKITAAALAGGGALVVIRKARRAKPQPKTPRRLRSSLAAALTCRQHKRGPAKSARLRKLRRK
jgi:hypothetical protein